MKKTLFFLGLLFIAFDCFSQVETDVLKSIDKLKVEKEAKLAEKEKVDKNLDLSRKDYDSIVKTISNRIVEIDTELEKLTKMQNEKDIKRLKSQGFIVERSENFDSLPLSEKLIRIKNDKEKLAGTNMKFKATIWNTNFSIPIARFNFTRGEETKKGDLILFNSIGAGFGISFGEFEIVRDTNGEIINQEFTNTFGLHLGVLFSAGTGENGKNIFAPTLNMSVLDFQFGFGYELGTISENQNRGFVTIAYAIPLYKLRKGGFWIWRSGFKPINDVEKGGVLGSK